MVASHVKMLFSLISLSAYQLQLAYQLIGLLAYQLITLSALSAYWVSLVASHVGGKQGAKVNRATFFPLSETRANQKKKN